MRHGNTPLQKILQAMAICKIWQKMASLQAYLVPVITPPKRLDYVQMALTKLMIIGKHFTLLNMPSKTIIVVAIAPLIHTTGD